MFGINDDDKTQADARRSQLDNDRPTDEHADKSIGDTSLPAAYSSLSTNDQPELPATGRAQPTNTVPEEDLLHIKTQALQSLAPLVGHLEQSPEEKFKTTMMMIQASDNADLIRGAYAAATAIEDEKARAQALLDVINEINYFTQRSKG